MESQLGVLIVDDDQSVIDLLKVVVPLNDQLVVIAAAQDGLEAIAWAAELNPDVIVLDHMMPGLTGAEVAPRIAQIAPHAEIIFFTAYFDAPEGGALFKLAAERGWEVIAKGDTDQLEEALCRVAGRKVSDARAVQTYGPEAPRSLSPA